jgi:cellulose synthase/poly-beta-1,6-N-acetylglucosamine synthase-like glycosyltransferase
MDEELLPQLLATRGESLSTSLLLSVVITSYTMNRLPDVLELIESLGKQTYSNIEVIFVGEGTRELCERVEKFGREKGMTNLRMAFNEGQAGLSFARNLGVHCCRGEIIAFTDDDAVVAPDWAEQIVRTFMSYPEVIGVTGQAIPLWVGDGAQWFPQEFDWVIGSTRFTEWRDLRQVRNAFGVNMAFRREAFRYCLFSEALVGGNQGNPDGAKGGLLGEDTLFSLELYSKTKKPMLYTPTAKVYNKVYANRLQPRFVRRRAFWEGYTKRTLVRNYDMDNAVKLSTELHLLRRIIFCFFPRALWQLTYNAPIAWRKLMLALDVLFHVALGYFAASFPRIGRLFAQRYGG